MCANSSDHVSNIVLTPSPGSLSNDPLNLFCPSFQPILLRLHNSLRSGVSITAFGTEGGVEAEGMAGRRVKGKCKKVQRGRGMKVFTGH